MMPVYADAADVRLLFAAFFARQLFFLLPLIY